ncbi:Sulfite exporter TauE/SafE [Novipirellula artificiosorum]|uniref:Probable membrane transporter protein n=2 Tax=Novipirellula artificiosorum TaxID=2528016 RepID=A0A5C6D8Z9_9BACT|nr:Sulfite exporter TauE/SafE [Novipirellula artificiosorum]
MLDMVYLVIGALGIGFSKSGFPGVSMLHVIVFALVFGTKESTGVLLPMLVIGDFCAIKFFGRKADWSHVRKLLPPTLLGIVMGWLLMGRLNEDAFRLLVGTIIMVLTGIQVLRLWRPESFDGVPHTPWFAIVLGLLAGMTTMLANAAGPVVALYLVAVNMPKWELIGSSAWLFLVLNLIKLPLSFNLGLIHLESLVVDAMFAPAIPIGMLAGRWLVSRVPQRWFNSILLAFTAIAAARLLGWI